MIDLNFYKNTGPYTVKKLSEMIEVEMANCHLHKKITGVSPLHLASTSHITFYHNQKYKQSLQKTKAGVCILHPDHALDTPPHLGLFFSKNPYRTYNLQYGYTDCFFV